MSEARMKEIAALLRKTKPDSSEWERLTKELDRLLDAEVGGKGPDVGAEWEKERHGR